MVGVLGEGFTRGCCGGWQHRPSDHATPTRARSGWLTALPPFSLSAHCTQGVAHFVTKLPPDTASQVLAFVQATAERGEAVIVVTDGVSGFDLLLHRVSLLGQGLLPGTDQVDGRRVLLQARHTELTGN